MNPTVIFEQVNKTIKGRIAMTLPEAFTLADMIVRAGDGDHLEIGAMWGGSAIFTALIKREIGLKGDLYIIDPFTDLDAGGFGQPSEAIFWENVKRFNLEKKIRLFVQKSDPFPLKDHKFASALIDGDHRTPWPGLDWSNVSRVAKFIAVHDTQEHPVKTMLEKTGRTPILHRQRMAIFQL